jgi:hypothetical protein
VISPSWHRSACWARAIRADPADLDCAARRRPDRASLSRHVVAGLVGVVGAWLLVAWPDRERALGSALGDAP